MQSFERVLACVEGYLQLGLLEDALDELERMPAPGKGRPEWLQLKVAALVKAVRWEEALVCCEELIRRAPESHHGYIHASFCLHELGRTLEARNRLLAAPRFVTEQALFYYNLACYEAQLENPDEAATLLRIAFRRDGSLCRVAISDRDLEPLREMVKALVQSMERSPDAAEEESMEDLDEP